VAIKAHGCDFNDGIGLGIQAGGFNINGDK
jgi:hypothetical protein